MDKRGTPPIQAFQPYAMTKRFTANLTRRRLLRAALEVTAAAFAFGIGDSLLIEPEEIRTVEMEIPLSRLGKQWDGLRIAQLSDFHYVGPHDGELIQKAVQATNKLAPDLVLLTGDFVTFYQGSAEASARKAYPCAEILSDLKAPLGVFAVLGNHDECGPKIVTRALEMHGIAVLRNFALFVERRGARLWLAGVDDVLYGDPRLEDALKTIPKDGFTILLAHEPDFAETARRYPVDLQLSGHSHGGQVRLPLIGAPYLPPMARRYPMGLRKLDSLTLYTNCGLGTTFLPARFNDPPEVTSMVLRSQ